MGKLAMGTGGAITLQRKIQDELLNRGYSSDSDPVMAEYITIMIINDKTPEQINSELSDLIGSDYESNFTEWLFEEAAKAANPPVTPLAVDEPLTSEAQPRRLSGGANLLQAALSGVHPPTGPSSTRSGASPSVGQKRTATARSPSPSSGSGPNKTRRTDTPTGPRAMMDRSIGHHQNGRSLIDRVGGHARRGNFGGQGGLSPAQASHIQAKIDNITGNPMPLMNGQPIPMNANPGMNFSFQEMMMMNMDLMRQMAVTMGMGPTGGMMPMVPGFGFPQSGIPQPQPPPGAFGPNPQGFSGPQQGVGRGATSGRGGMGGRGRGGTPSHSSHTQAALAPVATPSLTSAATSAATPAPVTTPLGQLPERPSTPSLCKYGLKCTNPQCRFSHPSPVATVESGMVLSTDFCPQGKACKDKDCKMGHVSPSIVNGTANKSQPIHAAPPPVSAPASSPTFCKFGLKCTRPGCMFTHPPNFRPPHTIAAVQCRFGSGCTRGDCPFQHPPGHVPANMFYRGLSTDAPLVEGYVSPHKSVRFGADGKATTATATTQGKTEKKEEKELKAVALNKDTVGEKAVDVGA